MQESNEAVVTIPVPSRDVLTGVLTSSLGQGMEIESAMCAAVYLHGAAGDAVAKRLGDRGMLATDLMDALPVVIKSIVS